MLYDVLLLSLRSSDSWGGKKQLGIYFLCDFSPPPPKNQSFYIISYKLAGGQEISNTAGDFKARQKQTKETTARYFVMSSIPLSKISRAVQLVNRSILRNFWQCLWQALTPRPTFFWSNQALPVLPCMSSFGNLTALRSVDCLRLTYALVAGRSLFSIIPVT